MVDPGISTRQVHVRRHTGLKLERSSWDYVYRDIGNHIAPRRQRFFTSDRNQGFKREQNIINNTPTRAQDTTASGMQSGLTSQSRPWYRLVAPTPELGKVAAVRDWLHTVEEVMREVIARSNAYNCFHMVYGDLAAFGTSVMYVEEDTEEIIRCFVFSVGQYCLILDSRGRVSGLYRETSMTVEQLVEMFTLEKCSLAVKNMFAAKQYDQIVLVTHVIEANKQFEYGKAGPRGMKYSSVWFETSGDDSVGMLREAGFEEQCFMAPRWGVNSEDTYGYCPGMEVLGDCKSLQLLEKREAQAFDKVVNPPMVGPAGLLGQRVSLLPGDVTYVDSMTPGQSFKPAHEVHAQALPAFEAAKQRCEERIKAGFHADLWLTMQRIDAGRMTATEVSARQQEQMILLGPVVERQQDELHSPFIDRVFGICYRRNLFPPPPPEIQGYALKVEYISILAQAQKLMGTTAIERLAMFVLNQAAANPGALDVLNWDKAITEYGGMLGVAPSVINSAEVIKAARAAKAAQQQKMAQLQQGMAMAKSAKDLAGADLGNPNALTAMLGNLGVH